MPISVRLPFDSKGVSIRVTQEPGVGSHASGDPALYNAWDFALGLGEKVLAIADGKIIDIRETVPDSTNVNNVSSLGSGAIGNIVTIEHNSNGQKYYSTVMHLQMNSVPFEINQSVKAGDVIGLVGNTGARTGTHLHLQVGTTLTSFGNPSGTGGIVWPVGSDNSNSQKIANALNNSVNKTLISFDGYGVDLPSSVVGPSVSTTPIASISDASVAEGGLLTFTVTLDKAATTATKVFFETKSDTASSNDFAGKSGFVTIAAGSKSGTFTVSTVNDTIKESTEKMSVKLVAATGYTLGDGSGVGTILDNDSGTPAKPVVSILDATATEGGTLNFTVKLDKAATSAITVAYQTATGTASSSDFTGKTSTVTIAAGQTTGTISINTATDTLKESSETMTVKLTSATGATLGDANATGTITDKVIATKAELQIDRFAIEDTSLSAGQDLIVTVDVRNTGGTDVSNAKTNFYWSANDQFSFASDKLLGTEGHNTLSAGELDTNEKLTIRAADIAKHGSGFIFAVIDPDNTSIETNESNNISGPKSITVSGGGSTSLPDLRIADFGLKDRSLSNNQDMVIELEVSNKGSVDASDTKTFFFWSRDNRFDSSDTPIGSDTHGTLSAGETDTNEGATIKYSVMKFLGDGFIFAVIDGGNSIAESNESNNVSSAIQLDIL